MNATQRLDAAQDLSVRLVVASPGDRPVARLPALDLLRFLAAFAVAAFHLVAVAGNQGVSIWGRPSEGSSDRCVSSRRGGGWASPSSS